MGYPGCGGGFETRSEGLAGINTAAWGRGGQGGGQTKGPERSVWPELRDPNASAIVSSRDETGRKSQEHTVVISH